MYAILLKYWSVACHDVHAIEVDNRCRNDEHVEYLMALKLSHQTLQYNEYYRVTKELNRLIDNTCNSSNTILPKPDVVFDELFSTTVFQPKESVHRDKDSCPLIYRI